MCWSNWSVLFLRIMFLLANPSGCMVIGSIFESLSKVLVIAMVIIFQPELRRGLAAPRRSPDVFRRQPEPGDARVGPGDDLRPREPPARRARGAGARAEYRELRRERREARLRAFYGTRSPAFSSPDARCTMAASSSATRIGASSPRPAFFPITQRADLDRALGLRHRAALGLSEESDAIIIVVSEETGIVSICHRGHIERSFDPESFDHRLAELFSLKDESDPKQIGWQSCCP